MRIGQWAGLALGAACTACASLPAARPQFPVGSAPLTASLQVPYVSQSELLCGGAAIAMVERWWGRRGVQADSFSYLVQKDAGGIFTTDMEQVARARGWETQALSASSDLVRQSLADGVPVIALIAVATTRYHYVVVTAWNATTVTYHDPAVAPSVTVGVPGFLRRWKGARQWAMFLRPAEFVAPVSAPRVISPSPESVDSLPCRPWLDDAAAAATGNRFGDAEQSLREAEIACPSESLVLRERAGVRFRQRQYRDATRMAEAYLRVAPDDSLGWQLLASSRYLSGDAEGALQAWNVVGRPSIDLVRIDGTRHIAFRTLAEAIELSPGSLLTPHRLALARRRLADIPAVSQSRISYAVVAGGVAEARATVVERPLLAPRLQLFAVEAVRAATTQEVMLGVGAPLGAGLHLVIPTTVRLERSWETYRFAGGVADERRRASSGSVTAWLRPDLEVRWGARLEDWSEAGNYVALALGSALHLAADRVSLLADVERGVAVTDIASYSRISTRVAWAPPADWWSNSWSLHVGADWNTASTPRGLWPIAAGSLARAIPLRAHPLNVDGALPLAQAGVRIVHGGVAGDRNVVNAGRLAIGTGIFLDAARILSSRGSANGSRLYLDGGIGVRMKVADRRWGVTAAFEPTLPVRLSRLR
jgi:Peptidase_C39 like family